MLMDGAELVALQHNRFYRRSDGLVLDVGAYAAALEYGTAREGVVVGKPARLFFAAALADIGPRRAPAADPRGLRGTATLRLTHRLRRASGSPVRDGAPAAA
jgi:ribonucleotide monophosphatase NagD (HAD superfamily)